jgi:hypothetical protein
MIVRLFYTKNYSLVQWLMFGDLSGLISFPHDLAPAFADHYSIRILKTTCAFSADVRASIVQPFWNGMY